MAQSFLNPASIAPKLPDYEPSFLSGMLRHDQVQNYNKAIEDQFALQKMGLEDAGIDLEEKRKDLPIKDLKRAAERTTLEAKQPYLARLAVSEAENTLDEHGHKKRMRPLEYDKVLQEITKGKRDMDWEKMKREAGLITELLPRAMQLGPQEGAKWLRSQRERYNKAGYDLPDDLDNPANWKNLQEAMINTIPHLQKLAEHKANDAASIRVAEINAGSHERIAAANRAMQQDQFKLTGSNAVPTAIAIMNDPKATPEKKATATQILEYYINDKATQLAQKDYHKWMEVNPQAMKATPAQKQDMLDEAYFRNLNLARQQVGLPLYPAPTGKEMSAGK